MPDTPLGREAARFRAGNYLLSHRSLDMISIVDRNTREIVWARSKGVLDGQHQPQMLADGHIFLFDNGTMRGPVVRKFDPHDPDTAVWEYRDPETCFSPFRGGQQLLSNGNTLICESDCGRIFGITRTGHVVCDYYSPFFGGQLLNVCRAARYAPEVVEPLLDEAILGHSRERQ